MKFVATTLVLVASLYGYSNAANIRSAVQPDANEASYSDSKRDEAPRARGHLQKKQQTRSLEADASVEKKKALLKKEKLSSTTTERNGSFQTNIVGGQQSAVGEFPYYGKSL